MDIARTSAGPIIDDTFTTDIWMLLIHTLLMPALRCFVEVECMMPLQEISITCLLCIQLHAQCSKEVITALAVSESGAICTASRTYPHMFRRRELLEPVRRLSSGKHCCTDT